MNSNYQWQKQQANERIQAHMREAANQRLIKGQKAQGSSFLMRLWNKIRPLSRTADFPQERETRGNGRAMAAGSNGATNRLKAI
ncbi:MAG: hypothetical protein ACK2UJ_17465 [Candidatus Promineifilaceae bacterium]